MKIERIDHLNITVADSDRSVSSIARARNEIESVGEGRAALCSGNRRFTRPRRRGDGDGSDKRMPPISALSPRRRSTKSTRNLENCGVPVRSGARAGAIGTIQSSISTTRNASIEIDY